jgi:head-tail adaptor
MRAGRLRNELLIRKPTPITRDASGGEVQTWADVHVASWWCELVQVAGGQVFRGRGVHGQATHVASGRYEAGVLSEMRAELGARLFDIVRVENVENRGRELRLELKEQGV